MSGSEKRAPRDSRKVNVLTAEQEEFLFLIIVIPTHRVCAINRNSVPISASNDYEIKVIDIKRLLQPILPPFQR